MPNKENPAASEAMTPARADGRPQYYDIGPSDRVQCVTCLQNGVHAQYEQGNGFINDPANSPLSDGGVYTVCKDHIPDDAVIHDPLRKETRTKDGQNLWTEPDNPDATVPDFKE